MAPPPDWEDAVVTRSMARAAAALCDNDDEETRCQLDPLPVRLG
jgi:hypothetical protein